MSTLAWLLPTAMLASFALTWASRRYALHRQLLDFPNARSSHDRAVPRGGGVAIVVVYLSTITLLWVLGMMEREVFLAIAGAGGWVALVGFIDDHRPLPASARLVAHFLGAAWALYLLRDTLLGAAASPELALVTTLLAALGVVWFLNLYNFMDGIDGLASLEAITICAGGVVIFWLTEPEGLLWMLPATLLASVAGFLYWNYPPARIFMGDAGSGFLGVVIGCFALLALDQSIDALAAWLLLPGVFIVDSTVALIRRAWRRESLAAAHRSHAYQYAARRCGSHTPVSLGVFAINLIWLLPFAIVVALGWLSPYVALPLAYAPLVWLAFHFKSGAAELQHV